MLSFYVFSVPLSKKQNDYWKTVGSSGNWMILVTKWWNPIQQTSCHIHPAPQSDDLSVSAHEQTAPLGQLGGDRKKQIVISPCSRVQDKSIVGFLKDGCNRINLLWLHVLASGHVYIITIWYSSILSSILFIRVKTCKEFSSMTSLLPLDRFGKKNQLPSTWS